jgi:hypothetical protein
VPTRGQLRVWLKWVTQSGLLEKLPARYDPDGQGGSRAPGDVARSLLIALQDPESSGQTRAELTAETLRFQSWVENRLKWNRRAILAECAGEHPERESLDRWARAEIRRMERTAPPQPSPTVNPKCDPMWDGELDG